MLTFFRKIRKSLIDGSSARKYLLYAIGEIALVVIGILIALQINNWNEWRNDRQSEKEILNDLIINLESNISILKGRIAFFDRGLSSCKLILKVIDHHYQDHDSLGLHFSRATRGYGGADVISYLGYEALKNKGLDLITNKSVKDEILTLFESTYRNIISVDETFKAQNIYRNEVVGELFYHNGAHSMKPFDFEKVLKSHKYYSSLTDHQNNYRWMKEETESGLRETNRVLQLIKEELQGADRL
jgi:hypothetical protein